MLVTFNTNGNEKQKECARQWLNDEVIDIVYGGSKGSGKSYLGVSLIFADAFMYAGTRYFIARKCLNDLRKHTIPSIYEVFRHWGIDERYYKFNGQDNFFQLHNGSQVFLIDARYMPSDPEYTRFGSQQYTRGWIEEAGEFSTDAKNNLQATIGRWMNDAYGLTGKLLMTCNPAKNFLYNDYYKKFKDGKLETYRRFIQALPQDNKMLPKNYLRDLDRILTPSQRKRLLLGLWDYDDDPSLLIDSYDAICDVFTNDHVLPDDDERYLSTDLAAKGRDKWVVSTRRGFVFKIDIAQNYSREKEMELKIRALMLTNKIPHSRVIADSDGLGSYLGSYIDGIKEFHGGTPAVNREMYDKLKTECAYKLAELINKREMYIICTPEQAELIKQELAVLKEENIGNDLVRKSIIDKKQQKELLGRSPDFLDTLIMHMFWLLKKDGKGMKRTSYQKIRRNN